MGSLNLKDFGLDDTTGLAVQIGYFKVLLSDCSSSFFIKLCSLPATRLAAVSRHLGDFLKENQCRRNGFIYFCILPSNSCGARTATRYSGDLKAHFERLHDKKKVDGSLKVAPTRLRSIASVYLIFWLNTGGYYSLLLFK